MRRQVTECPESLGCGNASQFQNPERPTCNYVTLTVVSCSKHCAVSL